MQKNFLRLLSLLFLLAAIAFLFLAGFALYQSKLSTALLSFGSAISCTGLAIFLSTKSA
ncbi:hypothetical protein [Spirosoma foliorum]|uniref:Uncharacterized protein n=1 Tax=Spirosoma foliorum TaxID=2710596 RepID=A0A7G5H3G5_9BACT|nr:hypothetical protein [Spirosoma foliorum]QMW05657.1 hypothetical protein H3H32_12575 [Spirosoma foliorum]